MSKKFTVTSIEAFKPDPEKRREIPDGSLPGFYLVIQPSGTRSWAVRYRLNNRVVKYTIGSFEKFGLTEARDEAREIMRRAAKGEDPQAAKKTAAAKAATGDGTFPFVARRFLAEWSQVHCRSWSDVARNIGLEPDRKLDPSSDDPATFLIMPKSPASLWEKRPIESITPDDIDALLDLLLKPKKSGGRGLAQGANRVLSNLKKLFAWSVEKRLLAASPCAGIRKRLPEVERDRWLSEEELAAVWAASFEMDKGRLAGPFGSLLRLLILTGQRRDEVAEMPWSEVNLEKRLWTIPASRTKNKTEHTVPLSDAAMSILIERREASPKSPFVFSTNGTSPVSGHSRFKRNLDAELAKVIELPEWRVHDLRHTVASGMAEIGIAIPIIEKIINHRSGTFSGIVRRYQHYQFGAEKAAALDAWASKVLSLVNDQPSNVVPIAVGRVA